MKAEGLYRSAIPNDKEWLVGVGQVAAPKEKISPLGLHGDAGRGTDPQGGISELPLRSSCSGGVALSKYDFNRPTHNFF